LTHLQQVFHFKTSSFGVNGEWSPLAFEDNYFDAVYAVSVFTHLD